MTMPAEHSVQTVAHGFTDLCAQGKLSEAQRYWSDDVVSIEAFPGEYQVCRGREAVLAKQRAWNESVVMHAMRCEGPFIHGDQFSVIFQQECSDLEGNPQNLREVALYTVRGGQVVEERFFPMMPADQTPPAQPAI
ncbi:SnoaL-like domain-containing protein [Deinococcus sp.]|uniref:SnoaL-like domain-containing protein n=1 Tax=Deinococcus sp. TaxID=47478 RepID=UPI003CC55897